MSQFLKEASLSCKMLSRMALASIRICCFHSSFPSPGQQGGWIPESLRYSQGNRKLEGQDQPWHANSAHRSAVLEGDCAVSVFPYISPSSESSKKVFVRLLHTFLLCFLSSIFEFIPSPFCNGIVFIFVQFSTAATSCTIHTIQHTLNGAGKLVLYTYVPLFPLRILRGQRCRKKRKQTSTDVPNQNIGGHKTKSVLPTSVVINVTGRKTQCHWFLLYFTWRNSP